MSLYSLMEMAAEEQLSITVRRLWKKKNGSDPVTQQQEIQFKRLGGWILTWLFTATFLGMGIAIVIATGDDPGQSTYFISVLSLIALVVELGFFIPTCLEYMPRSGNSGWGFADLYKEACKNLGKSPFLVSRMKGEELLEAATAKMHELGRQIKAAEDEHGEYSKEKAAAKKKFEGAHKVFKLMGWIEDLGYGAFIPKSSELVATTPAGQAP